MTKKYLVEKKCEHIENSKLLYYSYYRQDIHVNNHLTGEVSSMLSLSVIDCGFDPWTVQTKDYMKLVFAAEHTIWRSKSKDWLAWNQDNVSK